MRKSINIEKQLIVTVGFLGKGRNYEDLHHAQYDVLSVSCCQLEISDGLQAGTNYRTGPQTSTPVHAHKHVCAPLKHTHTHAHSDKFACEQTNTGRHTHTHLSLFESCVCRCVHT
jgi:hypothetical protein